MRPRHTVYAHTDSESGRSASIHSVTGSDGVVRLSISGGWWAFPREWIPDVVRLCNAQSQRLREAAAQIYTAEKQNGEG